MASLATLNNGTENISRQFDLFDPFKYLFAGMWPSTNTGLDVQATDTGYVVEIPVPGFAPDQIEVTYKEGTLSISGKSDRRSVMRSFVVPDDIDPDGIQAIVEHGLLSLTLNRLPHAQPKKIPISSN